jgi:hypothetical protein
MLQQPSAYLAIKVEPLNLVNAVLDIDQAHIYVSMLIIHI